MTKNTNSLNVNIVTVRDGKQTMVAFSYNKREEKEKPMALDVLMQAQSEVIPDLAFFSLLLKEQTLMLSVIVIVLAISLTISSIDTLINAISSLIIVDGKKIYMVWRGYTF